MATLSGYDGKIKEHAPWLKATVSVDSEFEWDLERLKRRLAAGLAKGMPEGDGINYQLWWEAKLKLKMYYADKTAFPQYVISWSFDLPRVGDTKDVGEYLLETRDTILGVFTEMEEKYKERIAFDEPLEWLLEDDGGDDEDDALLAAYLHGCAEGQRAACAGDGSS